MRRTSLLSLMDSGLLKRWGASFRLSRFLIWAGVFLVLLITISEFFFFQQDLRQLQENIQVAEVGQARLIAQALYPHWRSADDPALKAKIATMAVLFPERRLWVLDKTGADQLGQMQGGLETPEYPYDLGQVAAQAIFDPAREGQLFTTWGLGLQSIWIGMPLLDPQDQAAAILLQQTDTSSMMARFYHSRLWHAGFVVAGVGAFYAIFAWLLYQLLILPLRKISSLSDCQPVKTKMICEEGFLLGEVRQVQSAFCQTVKSLLKQQVELDEISANRALERAASDAALQRRAEQLEAINDLIATTAITLDMNALLQMVLEEAIRNTQVEKGIIVIGQIHAKIGISEGSRFLFLQAAKRSEIDFEKTLIVHDWQVFLDHPTLAPQAQLMLQHDIRASFSQPIFIQGSLAGSFNLAHSQPRIWRTEETALLEIIAHKLGIAAERIKFVEEIRQHNALLHELVKQSERLNRPYTRSEVIVAIGEGTLSLSKADRIAVFTRNTHGDPDCTWSHNLSQPFLDRLINYGRLTYPAGHSNALEPLLIPDLTALEQNNLYRQMAETEGLRSIYAWPLVYENRASAYVCCFYDLPMQWVENEQELLETFFRQAAASLENARLFEAEKTQRRLAEALQDVTNTLTSTLNQNEVFDRLLENLKRVVPHNAADIMLIKNGMLQIGRSSGALEHQDDSLQYWSFPAKKLNNTVQMMATREAVVIPTVQSDPSWVSFPETAWIQSYAGAPICHCGMVIGFINVYGSEPGFFQRKTGEILMMFADQAAISIQNARLYEQTHQRMSESQALYRALQPLFHSIEDSRTLADQITEAVTQEFESAHCSVLLINETASELVMVAQAGELILQAPELSMQGPGLTVSAARTGQVVYSPDVTLEPDYIPGAEASRSELAIPLKVDGQVIGVLNLESPHANAFDERAIQLISSFADRAALGLENARLFATICQHADEIKKLNEINRIALQTNDSNTMLKQLAEQVASLLKADGCYITLWDESNQLTIPFAAYGPKQERYSEIDGKPGEVTLTLSSLKHERTLIIDDIHQSPYLDPKLAQFFPVCSILVLPLIENQLKMGALLVGFTKSHSFSSSEVALGEQAAGQIALAMAKLRSLEIAQRRAEEAENLRQATTALSTMLEPQQLLENTLNHLERVIQYDSATIFLLEGETVLRAWAAKNIERAEEVLCQYFPRSNHLFQMVERCGEPVILENAHADPNFQGWGATNLINCWMGVPLIAGNEFLGILTLDRKEQQPFSREEVELARAFANQAAIAVHNAQLHSAMQRLAITDPLTATYNRRGFFELAQEVIERCEADDRPISALMLDFDLFKQINDQYGHDAGDSVLKATAELLRATLRENDLICRYGGEEFAILLGESSAEAAWVVACRLHQIIVGNPIETTNGPVFVTVSVGIATQRETFRSLEYLLKCADQAMYRAKQKGRNQIYAWKE